MEPSLHFCEAADDNFFLKSCFLFFFPSFFPTQDTQKSQYFYTILKYSFLFPFIPPESDPSFPFTSYPLASCYPSSTFSFFISFLYPSLFSHLPLLLNSPHLKNYYDWKFLISLWNHTPLFCLSSYFCNSSIPLFYFTLPSILLHFVWIPPSLSPSLIKEQLSSPIPPICHCPLCLSCSPSSPKKSPG